MKFVSMAGVTGSYRVTLVDQEPVEVRVIAADIIRWEQANKKSFYEGNGVPFSRLAFIAWAAMRRQNLIDSKFDEFITQLEDLETEQQGEEAQAEQDEADEAGVPELPGPTGEDSTV